MQRPVLFGGPGAVLPRPVRVAVRSETAAPEPQVVTESGRQAGAAPAVRFLRTEGAAAVFEVAAGTYRFAA